MNLETKITIYKFTPQLFTLTRFNLIAELNDGKYLSAGLYFKICLK
ncbi:hypothetical protein PL690_15990 [Phocaeicola vulgatus]|nr:hypothetical protein [Phocaeicola vulgatus]